jgi:N-acetylglutamate synthase-like GNAT family acetyltransferase
VTSAKAPFDLRPARQTERDIIRRMVRRARLNPLGLVWERFTVAVDAADNVIGCVQLKAHKDGAGELASLVVMRSWRGKGIAAKLIGAVKEQSDGVLWLMCERGLVSFYERFGFRQVEEPSEMNPYFRRIWRLARFVGVITRRKSLLAIMRWRR